MTLHNFRAFADADKSNFLQFVFKVGIAKLKLKRVVIKHRLLISLLSYEITMNNDRQISCFIGALLKLTV
jgi:hypothetical protein